MSTLSEVSQSGIGWVYPPQPQQERIIIEEVAGLLSGITPLISGQDYIDVEFGEDQPSLDWVMIEASIENTTDPTVLNVWRGVITSKTTTGFRLQLNGTPDSANYFLYWSIRGAFGYFFTGPTGGNENVASSAFTVELPIESTLTGTVIITPSDNGGGGSFSPTTRSLTAASRTGTFTYTPPTGAGVKTISVTNNRGLTNPASRTYTVVHVPTIIVHDTFTGANGTGLPSHTLDTGGTWTRYSGAGVDQMTIQSNKAQTVLEPLHFYGYGHDAGVADCTIEQTAVFGGADIFHACELLFRITDASNFWRLTCDGTGAITLYKYVAGSPTSMATGTTTIVAGVAVLFTVVLNGTSISCTIGAGAPLNVTDAFNQTATKHGPSTYYSSGGAVAHSTIDEFKVTA